MLALVGLIGLSILCPNPVFADDNSTVCNSGAAESVKKAAGCGGTGDQLPGVIQAIVNSIILVCGTIAVVFIVIGGISFITSSGDPGKAKKAKDTILYAVIGLIIAALAFAIVNWVISIIPK